jgi:hypothetical protein
MWDERYRGPDYAYGTEPNDFLVATADQLPAGRVLCLREGAFHAGVGAVVQVLGRRPVEP